MTRCVFFQTIPEEVFASNGAIWWSTTGKFLAYAEFNDTEVQKVEFTWYGAEQYTHTVAVPYPKVGSADCLPSPKQFKLPRLQVSAASAFIEPPSHGVCVAL